MITSCKNCAGSIRDCTAIEPASPVHVTGIGWYHTESGYEQCPGGRTMAQPVSLVGVNCPEHKRRPVPDCIPCVTASQVMIFFHEKDRCIPARCVWPHAQYG